MQTRRRKPFHYYAACLKTKDPFKVVNNEVTSTTHTINIIC